MNYEDLSFEFINEHLKQERERTNPKQQTNNPKKMDMGELSRDESGNYYVTMT